MAGNLGLALAEDGNEVADADLAPLHQVEQAQAGAVGKGGEKQRQVVALRGAFHRIHHIRVDRYVRRRIDLL